MLRRLLMVLVAALAFSAPMPAPAAADPAAPARAFVPPTIEAYTRAPALGFVDLSADGQKVAYVENVGDKRRLVVRRLNGLAVGEVLGVVDLGFQIVVDVHWADSVHVLVTASQFQRFAGERYIGFDAAAAHAYNIETHKIVRLLDRKPGLKYVAGAPFVGVVGGQRKTFVNSYGGSWEVDLDTGDGVLRDQYYGLTDASGRATVRSEFYWKASDNTFTWRLASRSGMDWTGLWSLHGNRIETPELLGYGRTANTVLVRTPVEGQEALFEVDTTSGARKRLGFPEASGEVDPMYDTETQKLLGFAFTGANDHTTYFLDDSLQALWDATAAGFPGKQVTLTSRTPDFARLVVYTTGAGDAGTYWLVDAKDHKAARLGSAHPDIAAGQVAEQRFIKYKAADGFEVAAYLTLPIGRDPRSLPLIVMPHGGPQARDEPGFDGWAQMLASRGYAVLQPEYRGSDGFGAAYYHAGYGEWGGKMITDLSDSVAYLSGQGIIDPKRVCIFGWSYGGYAALWAPIKEPGVYRCAAAGAGLSDLRAMLFWERGREGAHETPVLRYEARYMGAKGDNDPRLDDISPARHAERMTIPLMIVHGQSDMNVPYEQTLTMTRALDRAGRPYELVAIAAEGHNLQKPASRLTAFTSLIGFLEKNNPPY
ncbi:MAG: peptidase prolyl oligopeptidase active site domain protein [Caulobacter sp.]|nr:peptidase prolyl oligopeptidase active site domain protein [Caulobacter sp.]